MKPMLKAAQLEQLSDAGRFKGRGKPMPSKFLFSAVMSICLFTSHLLNADEQLFLKHLNAHLTIKDYPSAIAHLQETLKTYPESKPLREAQIKAFALMGEEQQMMNAWKNYRSLFSDALENQELVEALSWGVIKKGAISTSPLIRILSSLAAFLSHDAQGVSIIYKNLSDQNTLIRATAVQLSAQMRDTKLKERVLKLFQIETDWKVRLAIIQSLGDMKIKEAHDALLSLVADPKKTAEEKQLAILSLVSIVETISEDELKTLVKSSRAHLRALSCRLVIALQPKHVEYLIAPLVQDESAEVRATAWQALGVLRVKDVEGFDLDQLAKQTLQEVNTEVKVSAAWFMLLKDPSVGEKMMQKIFQAEDKDTQLLVTGALRASGLYGTPLAFQLFQETQDPFIKLNLSLALIPQQSHIAQASDAIYQICMNSKERWMEEEHPLFTRIVPSDIKFSDDETISNYPDVVDQLTRLGVLNILAIVKNPHAQTAIESFLLYKDWGITGIASALLLTEGDETTLTLIRNLLRHTNSKIKIQAALILALWGSDEQALETLVEAYPTASRELKEHILEGLGKMGSRSTIPFLIDRLSEPYQSLRIIAALGILEALYH